MRDFGRRVTTVDLLTGLYYRIRALDAPTVSVLSHPLSDYLEQALCPSNL